MAIPARSLLTYLGAGHELLDRPIRLPGDCADARFQTESSYYLLHCCVTAFPRDHLRNDYHFRRVWNIGTIDASQAKPSLRERMKQK